MSWRVVKFNEEVQACRPNTCQWRAAKIMEDANQGQHSSVRVKFIGDTAIHRIPWASIKLYQYPKSSSIFTSPIVSRSKNRSAQKIVSIDLTEADDIPSPPISQNGAPKRSAQSSEMENGLLRSFPDGKQNVPSPRQAAVAKAARDSGPPVQVSSKEGSTPLTLLSPSSSATKDGTAHGAKDSKCTPDSYKDNEIVWEWNPIQTEERLQRSSEFGFVQSVGNTPNGSVLPVNSSIDVGSKPLERHPLRGVEDIPIPRNLSRSNEKALSGNNGEILRGKRRNVNGNAMPSKRPRSSYNMHPQLATLLPPQWSICNVSRRLQKKEGRNHDVLPQEDPALERDKARAVANTSPKTTLSGFQPMNRFPFVQERDKMDDVDIHVKKSCEDMVSEHKNEVRAMLQALDELKLAKKPPRIQTRSGRRKSAKPKSWGHRKLTQQTVFQNGKDCAYPQQGVVCSTSQTPTPNPRNIKCVCGTVDADGGTGANYAALRCDVCGCLSHIKCIQFEDTDQDSEGSMNAKRFVCSFCVDDATDYNVAKIAIDDGSDREQHGFSSGKGNCFPGHELASATGQDWHSHVAPVVTVERSIKPPNSRARRKAPMISNRPKYRPRSPLGESEVEARARNIDFLRAGVLKRSVGAREQELIDSKAPTF